MTSKITNNTPHDKMREFHRRELLQLTVDTHRAGLTDIQREWPAHGLWDVQAQRWHWFDIAGLRMEKFYLFDFEPGYWNNQPNKPELEKMEQKKAWALANNIPLMIVPHGHTTLELTILIKKFFFYYLRWLIIQ